MSVVILLFLVVVSLWVWRDADPCVGTASGRRTDRGDEDRPAFAPESAIDRESVTLGIFNIVNCVIRSSNTRIGPSCSVP
jgi:hypothetical protein